MDLQDWAGSPNRAQGVSFYICADCFRFSETQDVCHGGLMMPCFAGEPGSLRRKPVWDERGRMVSRAPRWYLEAVGRQFPGGPRVKL